MQPTRPTTAIVVVLCLASFVAVKTAWAVESGPDTGKPVPALKVLVLKDDNSFQEHDVAAERSDKLSVYAFVQATEWSRPMARFLRGIDEALSDLGGDADMTAVWLSEDQDEAKRYLPRGRDALKLKATTFAVDGGDEQGPNGWNLNDKAFITVVVARDRKVVKSFSFVSVNETDVPAVRATFKAAAEK